MSEETAYGQGMPPRVSYFIRLSGRGREGNCKTAQTFKQESSRPSYSLFPLGQSAAVDVIRIPEGKPGQEG